MISLNRVWKFPDQILLPGRPQQQWPLSEAWAWVAGCGEQYPAETRKSTMEIFVKISSGVCKLLGVLKLVKGKMLSLNGF